jgi:MFS family permease
VSPIRELARDRILRRAAAALALYRLADYGPWVAILVYAYGQGGATATGLVSFGILIPTALFAPVAGPLIDRFGAGTVLVSAYALQALAMAATAAALLIGSPPPLVYVLAAVTAMLVTITHPAHAVASPSLARSTEQLVALNAVTGWLLSAGLVLGPAFAGAILAVSSPGAVYAVGATLLATATALVVPLRRIAPPLPDIAAGGLVAAMRRVHEGGRALLHMDASREVVLVLAATYMMVGAFDVLAVTLSLGPLGIGGSGAGYLTATHGVGAAAAAAASLGLLGRPRLVPVILTAAVLAGVGFLFLGLVTTLVVAFAVAAVAGVSRSLLEVTGQTLLQRVTPTRKLAGVFAFKEGLAMAAWGIGSGTVPLLVAVAGTTGAVVFTGAIVPAVVLLRLRRLIAVDTAVTVPVVTIALLRSLPLFRFLPVPALDGIAGATTDLTIAAGATVVREGDRGSRYYAVADGTFDVSKRGHPLNRLERGEGFGEIALLHDGVRTATVSTRTGGRLVALEREPFLVAVTGHGETNHRAHDIAFGRLRE